MNRTRNDLNLKLLKSVRASVPSSFKPVKAKKISIIVAKIGCVILLVNND